MIAIKKCPYCGDAWLYITRDAKYKINCRCGFAFKKTPKCAASELVKSVWNDIANNERKQSDFYPNADEDGMVDVSDYPYSK